MPVPDEKDAPLCVMPPRKTNAEFAELAQPPLPDKVTVPTKVFVPVALLKLTSPVISVVPLTVIVD